MLVKSDEPKIPSSSSREDGVSETVCRSTFSLGILWLRRSQVDYRVVYLLVYPHRRTETS